MNKKIALGAGVVGGFFIYSSFSERGIAGVLTYLGQRAGWELLFVPGLGILALLDLRNMHKVTRAPWGSVDYLWALAFFFLPMVGPFIWWVRAGDARERELSVEAERQEFPVIGSNRGV